MKKFLRFLVCLFVVAAVSLQASAQTDEAKYLVVDFTDATTVDFRLASKPVLTFADGKFVVSESQQEVASYDFSTVKGYHFSATRTDISSVTKGSLGISFTDNETIVVEGNEAFSASLFDAAGRTIDTKSANGGSVSLSLASQPAGVYIVKVSDGKSFKFLKK